MLSVIIEAIASTLAETFATKAVEKGQARHAKLFGWINLVVLLLIIVGCTWLGIYLITAGAWPIAVLMLAIAAFVLYVLVRSAMTGVKGRRKSNQ